ncbi:hypothetical protein HMPREF3169_08215 [Corynebacterium sp. HMSC08C04]|uniref:TRAFAC clade GTPase domain-containing protein n=1 Tax=unclassified Corynebacterium TaxID=2624378 RepID=UPI0008A55D1A|nr:MULTISPECIES: hypothetical protein [unclassified Corynebacterium]OFT33131.1 hypothetical protein HMPREF3169_08215 [Corynebacterium sp. HMSC08C04]OHO67131.1 hypothetical protein HMPREF2692_07160 [Corynebacterium sp. HMSC036D03]
MADFQFHQQIAVFGQAGSGKTVLLSSLYGHLNEQSVVDSNGYRFLAQESTDGNRLLQRYYGMKEKNVAPAADKFVSSKYDFKLMPISEPLGERSKRPRIHITWRDYPGEWFESKPSSEMEKEDRSATFRELVKSDVALVLVDGQKLVDYEGDEARYLKSLFTTLRNMLLTVREEILDGHEQLEQFPRIWVIALSKADLLPEMTAHDLQKMIILHAADELNGLRQVLADLVEGDKALSVGEDYAVLSSAEFAHGEIDVEQQKGLEAILPLATIFPIERYQRWAKLRILPAALLDEKLAKAGISLIMTLASGFNAQSFAPNLLKKLPRRLAGKWGKVQLIERIIQELDSLAVPMLEEKRQKALENHNFYEMLLSDFVLKIRQSIEDGFLKRSPQWG